MASQDNNLYDLFISHAKADRGWVRGYLIPNLGLPRERVITQHDFRPDRSSIVELERAVSSSRYTLLVLSPDYLIEGWSLLSELFDLRPKLGEQPDRFIPLFLQPCKMTASMDFPVQLDCTEEAKWEDAVNQLRERLGQEAQKSKPRSCPYPGMIPFNAKDARFFYGRKKEVNDLLSRLQNQNYLFVIGPVGSGKSSLIMAGLIPALQEWQPDSWLIKSMRPGHDPMQALANVLGSSLPDDPLSTEEYTGLVTSVLEQNLPLRRLLLVIDPFEDLFTQTEKIKQVAFIHALKALRQVKKCVLIMVLRADFYADLMTSNLWPLESGERLEITSLRGTALRDAIVKPAEVIGVNLDPRLVERLLNDAVDKSFVLTQIQETLAFIWGKKEGKVLTLEIYERMNIGSLGGLSLAIALKADGALTQLAEPQRAITRRIFLRLIQFGEKRADTGRQQSVVALRSTSDDPVLFDKTLDYLLEKGLLVVSGEEMDENRKVEMAHEALINCWPTLQRWLTVRRDAEQIRRRLEDKARRWKEHPDQSDNLLNAFELLEAERWLTSSDADDLGRGTILPALVQASRKAIEDMEREKEAARQRELTRIQALAEEQHRRVVESERLRRLSIIQAMVAQALRPQTHQFDERVALLARQAYLFTQRDQVPLLGEVDHALRAVMNARYFSVVLRGHEGLVRSVAFSPDGYTLASGSSDKTIRLWDLRNPGSEPLILQGHEGWVRSIAFSSDGNFLASGSNDKTIRLWNLQNLSIDPLILTGHDGWISSVAFSPDGHVLASGSDDRTVRLWDLQNPNVEPKVLRGYKGEVWSIAFSPDGYALASGSGDYTVKLWDLRQSNPDSTFLRGHEGFILSVAFSPDGNRLASGSNDGTVRVWDLRKPNAKALVLRGHEGFILSVAFSSDGNTLASGGNDNIVRVWDLEKPVTEPVVLQGHGSEVLSVAFSSDGSTLASGSNDNTVRTWDLRKFYAEPIILKGHEGEVLLAVYSPDGRMLASGSNDKTIRVWDLQNPGNDPIVLEGHKGEVFSVAFNPNGTTLISGSSDNTMRVWDLKEPDAKSKILGGHEGVVRSVAFSPDGHTLASGGSDKTVRIWNLQMPHIKPVILRGHEGRVRSVMFSSDGYTLASGSSDKTVRVWDLRKPNAKPIVLIGHEGRVLSVALSPDGYTLASGSSDKTVRVWDLKNPKTKGIILRGHEEVVRSVAFSPDGNTLVSGSEDKTIRLWDLRNPNAEPIILRGHEDVIRSVVFSPDGTTLASSSSDKKILIWFTTGALANKVCEKVWRNLSHDEWNQFIGPDIPYERTCSNLPIHSSFIEAGRDLARSGKILEAIALYRKVQALDPERQISAEAWNTLGWFGSLWGHAAEVMYACEEGIKLDPGEVSFRDSRGLARALIGDINGAIDDFQAFIDKTENREERFQRQRWIEALRAGRNPFPPEELERLRSE